MNNTRKNSMTIGDSKSVVQMVNSGDSRDVILALQILADSQKKIDKTYKIRLLKALKKGRQVAFEENGKKIAKDDPQYTIVDTLIKNVDNIYNIKRLTSMLNRKERYGVIRRYKKKGINLQE